MKQWIKCHGIHGPDWAVFLQISSSLCQLVCFLEEGFSGDILECEYCKKLLAVFFFSCGGSGVVKLILENLHATYWRTVILPLYAFLCSWGGIIESVWLKKTFKFESSCKLIAFFSHEPFFSACISLICTILLCRPFSEHSFLSWLGI